MRVHIYSQRHLSDGGLSGIDHAYWTVTTPPCPCCPLRPVPQTRHVCGIRPTEIDFTSYWLGGCSGSFLACTVLDVLGALDGSGSKGSLLLGAVSALGARGACVAAR